MTYKALVEVNQAIFCLVVLLTHIKSIHEGIKYPCDQCDFKATHKGTLKSHMKSIHEGVNLWKHIKSKHLH